MEPQPGLFVSSPSKDDWEPDPDVGGMMLTLWDLPGLNAGFTRYDTDPGPVAWTPPQRETVIVLEGATRIEMTDGTTLTLEAGDAASLPAGAEATWYITAAYNEFWVFSGPGVEPEGGLHG